MKRGMHTLSGDAIFSDAQVASIRLVIASLVLFPWAIKAIKRLKKHQVSIVFSNCRSLW